jgi:type I restriction enzyme R subunit
MADNIKGKHVNRTDITTNARYIESCYQKLLNFFRENGVDRIQQLVEDSITDQDALFDILDQALGVLNGTGQREKFKKYYQNFQQSINTISSKDGADPYEVPVKEFGQISTIMQRMEVDCSERPDRVS